VQPELLLRFLRPFAAYLHARGIRLEGAFGEGWMAELHRTLNAVDPAMPPELQQGLLDIADLTSEAAHEQVLALAQQLDLFAERAQTTPEDLAFAVYLDHRDLFRMVPCSRAMGAASVQQMTLLVGQGGAE
jgi:hypothetical protein